LGHTRLENEFKGISFAPDIKPRNPDDVVLRAIPRHLGGVLQVVMEITADGSFSRILVAQEDGSTTEFLFFNQKENVNILDERFRFLPPPGVETINVEQLGQ
jgi:outer membrane lipoprotein carrier protein